MPCSGNSWQQLLTVALQVCEPQWSVAHGIKPLSPTSSSEDWLRIII